MSQFFQIHPDNPQLRLIKQAVQIIDNGGIVALPTDSCYALVCHLDDKDAVTRLRKIRGVDEKHHHGGYLGKHRRNAQVDDEAYLFTSRHLLAVAYLGEQNVTLLHVFWFWRANIIKKARIAGFFKTKISSIPNILATFT